MLFKFILNTTQTKNSHPKIGLAVYIIINNANDYFPIKPLIPIILTQY